MATGSLRKPRRLMNQINVVPYIDVMLVLLVIFMITAPLINPGQIDLPQVGQGLTSPSLPLEVIITKDAKLMLRDRTEGDDERSVTRAEVIRIIRDKQRDNPEQSVVIAADRSVRYEEVLRVMDMLQQARIKRIGLLAKPKAG